MIAVFFATLFGLLVAALISGVLNSLGFKRLAVGVLGIALFYTIGMTVLFVFI